MARIRTVKPEFFAHYELFELEKETGFPVRLAFAGLWTLCDREGRFKWRPEQLKLGCIPYDSVDFSRVLDALATRGFVVKYSHGGKDFGVVPSFSDHQIVNNRETRSVLPEPPESHCLTRAPRVDDACPTPLSLDQGEGKGREGKGTVINTQQTNVKKSQTIKQKLTKTDLVNEFDIEPEVAEAWLVIRNAKKSALTRVAMKSLINEFSKAGLSTPDGIRLCAESGWVGFKASWDWKAATTSDADQLGGGTKIFRAGDVQ